MADIAVIGTVAADIVLRVPVLPGPGDHVEAEPLGWRLGGSSANVACGLAAAGHRVELIGPIGTDAMAAALVAELSQRGVGTAHCMRVPGSSPRALIMIDPVGERTIVVVGSPPAPVDVALPEGLDCVYVESFARFPVADRLPDALVVATPPTGGPWPADVVVGSEQQLSADPFAAARAAAGPRLQWVVVTRGARGASAFGPGGEHHAAARPARQVDATGAGDAFAAGLIAALLAGRDIDGALEWGADYGAAAVGALQSVPPEWIA